MPWRTLASIAAIATMLVAAVAPAVAQIAPDPQGPSAAKSARTLRDLVDRYLAWRGPAFAQLQTIHERLQVDTSGGRQMGELWIDRDGRTRRQTVVGGAPSVQVAAPEASWRARPGGAPEDDPGAYEAARRYALLEFGDALTGRGGASPQLAGTAEVEDHTWSVVQVSFGDADIYDVMLDPQSGGLCCYRIVEKGVTRTQLFGEWRLVDGVRMPFAVLTKTDGETQSQVSAIELNRTLEASLFERPKPSAGG